MKLPTRGLTIAAGKKCAISFFDEDSDTTYAVTLGKLSSRAFSNADLQVVVSVNTGDNGGSSISNSFAGGSSSSNDNDNGGLFDDPWGGSDDGDYYVVPGVYDEDGG